jgi:hypothetical protein
MGLTRKIVIAVAVSATISALAAGTTTAAQQPLNLFAGPPEPFLLSVPVRVQEFAGNVSLVWKAKSKIMRCETGRAGMTFTGTLVSNSQPTDQITIPRLKTEELCAPSSELLANVYQETEPLILSASSSGSAELSSPSGKVKMRLEIAEGVAEPIECYYEKAQLKGTNTATPPPAPGFERKPLVFNFSAESGATVLNLNEKAPNEPGCPTSFGFGMETSELKLFESPPELTQQVGA